MAGYRPRDIIAFAQRQLKVSLVCLLLIIALSLVGHRAFQSFSALKPVKFAVCTGECHRDRQCVLDEGRGRMERGAGRDALSNLSQHHEQFVTATALGTTPQSIFFDATGAADQTFFYWVRAENGSNVSSLSQSDQGCAQRRKYRWTDSASESAARAAGKSGDGGEGLSRQSSVLGRTAFIHAHRRVRHLSLCDQRRLRRALDQSTARARETRARTRLFNTADDVFASPGVISNNIDGTYNWSASYGFGEQVTGRKSRSYVDAGYSNTLFWDGRATATFTDPHRRRRRAAKRRRVGKSGARTAGQRRLRWPTSIANWNDVAVRVTQSKPLALSPSVPAALNDWIDGRTYPELFEEAVGTPKSRPRASRWRSRLSSAPFFQIELVRSRRFSKSRR